LTIVGAAAKVRGVSGKKVASKGTRAADDDNEGRRWVNVNELRRDDYQGTCLRPLGMCELGACDVCWYSPDHPRHRHKG
jgi:hypothetical protein